MQEKKPEKWYHIYSWCERVIFPAFLLLYPLRHICLGAEWGDTGYNYGNFQYMDQMDPMWVFSTYLGNALGHFFTGLPFGGYMIGMNVYTGLLISLLALGGYFFFLKKVKLPAWITFAGEVLAINLCWCPTALLYNYLTYVLLGAGVIFLYCALTEGKNRYLVFAGICLGVNIFVRFPNLAEMGLIVGVWAYGIIRRKKFARVLAETGWCVLGYLTGAGICLAYLAARYGLGEYLGAIERLLSMPSEASDYTVYSMVLAQIQNYHQNLIWLGYLALFTGLGILGFAVLPGKFVRIKKSGYVACVFLGFYFLMMRNMFNLKYTTKLSVLQWGIFLLTATWIAGLAVIFRKKAADEDKLILGLGILVMVITPLGSNNHLYASINNLFLIAPFTLWMIYRLLRRLPEKCVLKGKGRALEKLPGIPIFFFPVKAMILCMLFMLGIQSSAFGAVYVFHEGDNGENLHTKIENNDVLKGMYTSPERAEAIETVSLYVAEKGLAGQEVILYGKIPAMSYYLRMPFAITSWPDLASYNYGVMKEDLAKLSEQIMSGQREFPVLLLEAGLKETLMGDTPAADLKLALLQEWVHKYSYRITFENDKFILLETDR